MGERTGDIFFAIKARILLSADIVNLNSGVSEDNICIAAEHRNITLPAREINSILLDFTALNIFESFGSLYFGNSIESGGAFLPFDIKTREIYDINIPKIYIIEAASALCEGKKEAVMRENTGKRAPHGMKGREYITFFLSDFSSICVERTAGTVQPSPVMSGINDFPERPRARMGASMTNAARAIYPLSFNTSMSANNIAMRGKSEITEPMPFSNTVITKFFTSFPAPAKFINFSRREIKKEKIFIVKKQNASPAAENVNANMNAIMRKNNGIPTDFRHMSESSLSSKA